MADGRHVGKYSKCHNSPTNVPTGTQFGWSHPIMCPTCPPWCSVAMATAVLPSNDALNILQSWASGGRTRQPILMKFGTQQQVRTAMTVMKSNIKIFKIQNGGGRHVGKYSKCHNSPTNGPTGTQLGWSHPIICPAWCGCHGNDALNILQLWASGGRTHEPILMEFGMQQQVRTAMTVMRSNIKIFKIQNGGRPPCWKIF